MRNLVSLILVLVLSVSVFAVSTTVTLQQGLNGYAGTEDTYIWQSNNLLNYGGSNQILTRNVSGGLVEGMIRFDVSSVPAGSIIESAKLKLYYFGDYATPGLETMNFTRLKRYWEEGSGSGTGYNVGAGGVCWTYYDYLETGTADSGWVGYGRSWISREDGAAGAKGTGDVYPNVSGSVTFTGTGAYGTLTNPGWIEVDLTSDLQAMINELENWGWIMQNTYSRRPRFYSSEAEDATLRPILEVTYIPEPATLVMLGLGSLLLRRKKN